MKFLISGLAIVLALATVTAGRADQQAAADAVLQMQVERGKAHVERQGADEAAAQAKSAEFAALDVRYLCVDPVRLEMGDTAFDWGYRQLYGKDQDGNVIEEYDPSGNRKMNYALELAAGVAQYNAGQQYFATLHAETQLPQPDWDAVETLADLANVCYVAAQYHYKAAQVFADNEPGEFPFGDGSPGAKQLFENAKALWEEGATLPPPGP